MYHKNMKLVIDTNLCLMMWDANIRYSRC